MDTTASRAADFITRLGALSPQEISALFVADLDEALIHFFARYAIHASAKAHVIGGSTSAIEAVLTMGYLLGRAEQRRASRIEALVVNHPQGVA